MEELIKLSEMLGKMGIMEAMLFVDDFEQFQEKKEAVANYHKDEPQLMSEISPIQSVSPYFLTTIRGVKLDIRCKTVVFEKKSRR